MADGATLAELASRPGLGPLWDELARRLGASERPVTSVTLRGLDMTAREALADLMGRDRLVAPTCRLAVGAVATALGLDDEEGLARIVAELRGPIGDRAAVRRAARDERAALWAWLGASADELEAPGWAAGIRAAGVPGGDVTGHRARLETAVAVVRGVVRLGEPISLAGLAAGALADPHGLDAGTPMAALVLGLLAARLGLAVPQSAEEARTVWAAAGVAPDELSPKVLVFGLSGDGSGSPLALALDAFAAASEPAALTLAQVRRWPFAGPVRPADVLVVENPSVVAEAARARREAAAGAWLGPVVCSAGWPNVAVLTLLRQLAATGARLRCHADFDPPGVLITRHLVHHVGAVPWRMGAGDYLAGVGAAATFEGSVADTPWDPELARAMRSRRRAVYEEDVVAVLIGDWGGARLP